MQSHIVYPTKKHNQPAPPAKIYLHGLDSHPTDIRNHRVFHRPSSNVAFKDVIRKLKSSLAEALELYPPAAGLVEADENGKIHIAINPQNHQGTPFLTDIKEIPFVTGSAELSPRMEKILPPGTSTLAVKVTQFSCGSIAVATSINHQVTDLRGFLDFLELWAQINRGEPVDYSKIPNDFTHTPNRFFSGLMEKAKAGPTTTAPPGFMIHDEPSTGFVDFLLAPSKVTNWILPSKAVNQLKAEVSPSADSSKDQWISSGDAVAALLWGAITRARAKAQVARIHPDSSFDTLLCAADGRERYPQKEMSKGKYFGNFNPLFLSTASRSDLLRGDGEGITRVALQIRTAINEQLSSEAIAAKIAFFENPQNLEPPGRITMVGDFILTNWCRNDLKGPKLDFGWGEAFFASSGAGTVYPPGYALLTQDKATGEIHVLLTVEEFAVDSLKNDPLMNKYADLVTIKT